MLIRDCPRPSVPPLFESVCLGDDTVIISSGTRTASACLVQPTIELMWLWYAEHSVYPIFILEKMEAQKCGAYSQNIAELFLRACVHIHTYLVFYV